MKKFLSLLLALICLLSMAACADTSSDTNDDNNSKSSDSVKTPKLSLDEQVIYDKDNFKVTVTSYEAATELLGPSIKILIENNTANDLTLTIDSSSVNGINTDFSLYADIAAGKKANDAISISDDYFEFAKINVVKDIEFILKLTDKNYNTVDTSVIKLTTKGSENYTQKYDYTGDCVLDKDGVKITYMTRSDSNSSTKLVFYIENNSEENMYIDFKESSVNGFMFDNLCSAIITPQSKTIEAMYLYDDMLEDNNITSIKEIEFKISMNSMDNFSPTYVSDVINITFPDAQ